MKDDSVNDGSVKFNRYFKSVFPSFAPTSLPSIVDKVCSKINNVTFDQNSIRKLLRNMKLVKAPGPDGISNIVLKSCADIVASYLLIIFMKSPESGRLLDNWKFVNLVAVHKNVKTKMPRTTAHFPNE